MRGKVRRRLVRRAVGKRWGTQTGCEEGGKAGVRRTENEKGDWTMSREMCGDGR